MKNTLSLSQAIEGFLLAKGAEGKSHHTIRNCTLDLKQLAEFVGRDKSLADINADDLRRFLLYLQQFPFWLST